MSPRILDDLKDLVGDGRESLANILDPLGRDTCDFCGGAGLEHMFCPGCGKWDHRSPIDIEDEAYLEENA